MSSRRRNGSRSSLRIPLPFGVLLQRTATRNGNTEGDENKSAEPGTSPDVRVLLTSPSRQSRGGGFAAPSADGCHCSDIACGLSGTAHPELVSIALGRTGGQDFERFSQDFLSAQLGVNFQPLGGVRDKGADGVLLPDVFEVDARADTFMQASIEEDVEGKIRHTVSRLREVGRAPTRLWLPEPSNTLIKWMRT